MAGSLLAQARDLVGGADKELAQRIVARADAARDSGRKLAAAFLYEEAAALRPNRAGIHIQCGHMFKEANMLERAGHHYLIARDLVPRDADLWLQLGHYYKLTGKLDDAEQAYQRSLALRPGWAAPAGELWRLRQSWGGGTGSDAPPLPVGAEYIPGPLAKNPLRFDTEAEAVANSGVGGRLAPTLVPVEPETMLRHYDEGVGIARLGQTEPSYWGKLRTVRGVAAIRGFCVSATPLVELQILLNGMSIHRGPLSDGYPLRFDLEPGVKKKFVFNEWLDFSRFGRGLYTVELRFLDAEDRVRVHHEQIVIEAPVPESESPASDALVALTPGDARPVEDQIRARPSMIRSAVRSLFPDGVRNVLILRTDQLGDMVASIPAMQRLRALLPDARFVGLLTGANAAFAETMPLFDEIIVVDFPDDPVERRRVMPLDQQDALRRQLEPYAFDLALDLASSNVSRDLLQVSGARFIYGVGGEDWPYLTGEFIFNTHDRWTRMDVVPHSSKVLAMIEALGAVLKTSAPVIPRDDQSRAVLEAYGIGADERYILLHAGARVIFSRWPHYAALAARLLAETGYRIVMMSEDAGVREALPAALLAEPRFLFLDQRLPFDHFDAFVSFATAMVGNDSGPKHLASLRGTNVVTLFTARINWTEWGQENVGKIISRRVPCAGCAIFHNLEDCGKGFACITDITPDEVMAALAEYL